MIKKTFTNAIFFSFAFLAFGLISDGLFPCKWLAGDVQARLGRPLTPGSVAGVARRTTRRTIRRTTVYVAALPAGCRTTVVINGATLFHCGGVYYQPQGNQYVVVNVD